MNLLSGLTDLFLISKAFPDSNIFLMVLHEPGTATISAGGLIDSTEVSLLSLNLDSSSLPTFLDLTGLELIEGDSKDDSLSNLCLESVIFPVLAVLRLAKRL
jgi:hypothetical protein